MMMKANAPAIEFPKATVWFLATLHTLAALSLIFILATLSPAQAEESKATCVGHNVLADLRVNDAATYEKIKDAAAAIPNADAVFWKVEKDGVPPSYLLGTMHMADPRVVDIPDSAKAAFADADTLVIESTEVLDPKAAAAALYARPELTMFTDGKSIYDFLKPDEKAALEAQLIERGIPLFAVSKMKPWMVTSFVALPSCELERKADGAAFLDQQLAKDAQATGKTLVGLETMAEQLEVMASLPVEFHVKGLVEMLKDPQKSEDMMETLIVLYDEGHPGWIGPLTEYLYPEDEAGFSMEEFERKMIIERNHTMDERVQPTLEKGNAFVAVGALHLSGNDGLVELFRKRGYTVSPL